MIGTPIELKTQRMAETRSVDKLQCSGCGVGREASVELILVD